MSFTHNIDGCLETSIGQHGLAPERLDFWLQSLGPVFAGLQAKARDGGFPHFDIAGKSADIAEAEVALAALCKGARLLYVLGTGGSSLGGQTLARLGGWAIPGDGGGPGAERRPRLRFYDNLDARSFAKGLARDDLAEARFLVISKSGGTAETLAQMLTAFAFLERRGLGGEIGRMFLAVSDPRIATGANGLRDLCEAYSIPVLDHPPGLGGRYSGLSIVGLMPLMARGLDARAVRAGAKAVVEALIRAKGPEDFAPAIGAAVSIGLAKDKGVICSVMMPYSDRLQRFAAWYVQLWAESLGKGGEGTTPVAALGPVDQHSQLQLYLDGPRHHLMTVMRLEPGAEGCPPIPQNLAKLAGAPYLGGFSIGDLTGAQGRAISDAFVEAQRPVRIIDIPKLDEAAMGGLMMHFMIETILAAALLGVDPFDQPAVELGKRIARDYLAKMTPGEGDNAGPPIADGGDQPHRGG